MNSYYGNYRTRKFADIFGSADAFVSEYGDSGIPSTISTTNATTLFYLLYARYGNSHIVNSDENQFKYKVWSIIFQYGPTWEKRLDIQSKLRLLTDADLLTGSKAIYNHSYNPSTAPSTSSLEELTTINDQKTTSYKRSKLDAYSILLDLLKTDVTGEFISKFQKLFISVVEPDYPLWYESEKEGD